MPEPDVQAYFPRLGFQGWFHVSQVQIKRGKYIVFYIPRRGKKTMKILPLFFISQYWQCLLNAN